MSRFIAIVALLLPAAGLNAAEPAKLTDVQQAMVQYLDGIEKEMIAVNQDIWEFAEVGLEEHRSSARLIGVLEKNGFKVKKGVSNMPTAFVAEYGSGKPVIGILAEYDALPELSQQVSPQRAPVLGRTTGHGCGHSALGTAALASALAIKNVYEKHNLKGTIRLYGTPAEETLIGKVYMVLDGQFKDLDACLHYHPSSKNRVEYGATKAAISVKFTFAGLPAHAAGSPDKGRSALDAVELMNVGVNYMREHVKESSRIHYVVTNGGQQPNVVPAQAQVWYYVRSNTHEDCEYLYDWVKDIAEGAAKMTRTKLTVQIDTDCHEIIPNLPLSEVVARNLTLIGGPKFTEADRKFAAQLQAPLREGFGLKEDRPLREDVEKLPAEPYPAEGGSTDVGDISWHIPTSGVNTACFAAGSPGHSWQNVAAVGSPIGHKGMMVAAKVLALSAVDMMQDPKVLEAGKADLTKRLGERKYTTRIPEGQKAPKSIR